jgi:hypothetical protein
MICLKCGRSLSAESFYRRKSGKRDSWCAECMRTSARLWRERNPEATRAYSKKYAAENKLKIVASRRRQYPRLRTRILQEVREYRLRNPMRKIARDTAYRELNREALRARQREWKTRDPLAYRDWVKRNSARRRGARRREKIDLQVIVDRQEGLCAYCALPLPVNWHLDHRIPLLRGGGHSMENVCAACPRCNCSKKAQTAQEFMARRQREQRLALERLG